MGDNTDLCSGWQDSHDLSLGTINQRSLSTELYSVQTIIVVIALDSVERVPNGK